MKPRRSQPATPMTNGLTVAAIAFVLPVLAGLVTGNMDLGDFGLIVLLTVVASVAVFAVSSVVQRRHQT